MRDFILIGVIVAQCALGWLSYTQGQDLSLATAQIEKNDRRLDKIDDILDERQLRVSKLEGQIGTLLNNAQAVLSNQGEIKALLERLSK